jgi:hypothetical protein
MVGLSRRVRRGWLPMMSSADCLCDGDCFGAVVLCRSAERRSADPDGL